MPTFTLMNQNQWNIQEQDIIFTDDILEACKATYQDYYLHIFLTSGSVRLRIKDKPFHASAGSGIVLIEGKPIQVLEVSDDAAATILLLSARYLKAGMPKITYNIKGLTYYYDHPVIPMTSEQMEQCLKDVEDIRSRCRNKEHLYYAETLKRSIDNFTYDLFDIYTRSYDKQTAKGGQAAYITQEFVNLLKASLQQERSVEYYADKLCVTPKYLSRACMQTTGHPASYWIGRFTLTRILEELTESNKTLTEISEAFNFQTLSHFTRFVKSHTGMTPSEYRMKKD